MEKGLIGIEIFPKQKEIEDLILEFLYKNSFLNPPISDFVRSWWFFGPKNTERTEKQNYLIKNIINFGSVNLKGNVKRILILSLGGNGVVKIHKSKDLGGYESSEVQKYNNLKSKSILAYLTLAIDDLIKNYFQEDLLYGYCLPQDLNDYCRIFSNPREWEKNSFEYSGEYLQELVEGYCQGLDFAKEDILEPKLLGFGV